MILTLITVGKMLEAQIERKDDGCTEESYEACTEDSNCNKEWRRD